MTYQSDGVEKIRVDGHEIIIEGLKIITKLPNGKTVSAYPNYDETSIERAKSLGYGKNVELMTRDHEILHALLSKWLRLDCSPTFLALSEGMVADNWQDEEYVVLALQRMCNSCKIDVLELARLYADG